MAALSRRLTAPEVRTFVRTSYVRDDRPFAGLDRPAALFFYSRNRNS
jgi:hypothetical protein